MLYKTYNPKDANGVSTESRKVRKGSRHAKWAFNHALHSARAKEERKKAAREAQA